MWRLVLHKFWMSLLTVICFVAGIAGYTLIIAPFNITYLLRIPAEMETDFAWAFAGLFVCVATVIVRTDWCYQTDFLLPQKGEKWYHRILRAATSREFLGDLIVCAFWWVVWFTVIVATQEVNWFKVAWKAPLRIVVYTLVFGVVDCFLYIIARKRAEDLNKTKIPSPRNRKGDFLLNRAGRGQHFISCMCQYWRYLSAWYPRDHACL